MLISALFAFASATDINDKQVILIALYLPAFVFWGLDGYFLALERRYRKLFDLVRTDDKDISAFEMNVDAVKEKVGGWLMAALSWTVSLFHGVVVIAITIAIKSI